MDPTGSGGGAGLDQPTGTLPAADAPTASVATVPRAPSAGSLQAGVASGPLPNAAALTAGSGVDLSRRGMGHRPQPRFGRHAVSPVPYMALALAAGAAAIGVVHWSVARVRHGSTEGISPTWWFGIQDVMLQSHLFGHIVGLQNLGLHRIDRPRLWWAVAAMGVAAVLLVLWVRRIGVNARADYGFFGGILVVMGLFAWWTLPVSINTAHTSTTRADALGEMRLRVTLALLIMLVQALFARWALVHKIWRAGRLPLEAIAYLLWIPQLVALSWMLGAWTWTVYSLHADGTGHSNWRPTEAMMRAEMWTTRITGVLVLAVLVASTIAQHIGIRQDRRLEEEWALH